MAQANLGRGIGTQVRDTQAPALGAFDLDTGTATGSWVEVTWPFDVAVEAVSGALGGTSVVAEIEIQSADDTSAGGLVSHGFFAPFGEGDDSVTRYLAARVYKRYIRADVTVAGSSPTGVVTVTVRDKDYHQRNATTA